MEDQNPQLARKCSSWHLFWFFGVAACVKILLIPAYRSTNFEVHHYWLALTHSLLLSRWYSDETSPWTLDYPPFFAYFEYFLSFFAHLVDPQIMHIHHGLNYEANTVIYFQWVNVIVSNLCLLYGVYRLTRIWSLGRDFDVGIGCLVCRAFDCGPYTFSVQWVFALIAAFVHFLLARSEGFDGWLSVCASIVFQTPVCICCPCLFCVFS